MEDVLTEFVRNEQDVALAIDRYITNKDGEKVKIMGLPYYLRFLTYDGDDGASIMLSGRPETLAGLICEILGYLGEQIIEPIKWLPANDVVRIYDERHGTHYLENNIAYIKSLKEKA